MLITKEYVFHRLPGRRPEAHKADFGRVLLLCGSVGLTGAAALAARAAVRSGAGLVYLGTPEPVYPILAGKLDEPMVFPLPAFDGKLAASAAGEILRRLPDMDAVLLGPGLGQSQGVLECVLAVLGAAECPVVLDADGINVVKHHIDLLRGCACPLIVTPHPGEFLRLGGELTSCRQTDAKKLAGALGCICVLKGHGTVVTDGKTVLVNDTGNPGMATGGSGDVLAGLLVSLLGQGLMPMDAAACAAWLHGAAGDLCAEEIGQYGMLPSDVIEALARLLP